MVNISEFQTDNSVEETLKLYEDVIQEVFDLLHDATDANQGDIVPPVEAAVDAIVEFLLHCKECHGLASTIQKLEENLIRAVKVAVQSASSEPKVN